MKKFKFTKTIATCLAICMVTLLFSGCGDSGNRDDKVITWYLPATETEAKVNVQNAINERLKELGSDLTLELIYIDTGNYTQKLQLLNASREEYDLCFTSNWYNDIYQSISGGSVADITDLLPKYAPKLYASMNENVWDAVRYNGKIYSVPNWQIQAKSLAFQVPAYKLEKTGMKIEDIKTMDDVTQYLEKLNKLEPQTNKFKDHWDVAHLYYGLAPVGSLMLPGMIRYASDDWSTVINQYESKEFEEYVKLVRGWVESGYIDEDYDTNTNYFKKGIEQGPFVFAINKPGGDKEVGRGAGYEFVQTQLGDSVLNTDGVTAAMTSVSATSDNIENAVKMLEYANTDPEIMNLICYGIEGVNYEKIGEKTIKKIANSNYSAPQAFFVASSKNLYVTEGTDENVWEETRKVNDNAKPSPILGFVPDNYEISGELANCQTVVNEQVGMLVRGLVPVEEGLAKLRKSLKDAGVDRVIEEYQRQLDEWIKNNK